MKKQEHSKSADLLYQGTFCPYSQYREPANFDDLEIWQGNMLFINLNIFGVLNDVLKQPQYLLLNT